MWSPPSPLPQCGHMSSAVHLECPDLSPPCLDPVLVNKSTSLPAHSDWCKRGQGTQTRLEMGTWRRWETGFLLIGLLNQEDREGAILIHMKSKRKKSLHEEWRQEGLPRAKKPKTWFIYLSSCLKSCLRLDPFLGFKPYKPIHYFLASASIIGCI